MRFPEPNREEFLFIGTEDNKYSPLSSFYPLGYYQDQSLQLKLELLNINKALYKDPKTQLHPAKLDFHNNGPAGKRQYQNQELFYNRALHLQNKRFIIHSYTKTLHITRNITIKQRKALFQKS